MSWRDQIHSDPEILGGKPVVRGTRLAVDFLLGLLAEGWSAEQVLDTLGLLRVAMGLEVHLAAECASRSPRRFVESYARM